MARALRLNPLEQRDCHGPLPSLRSRKSFFGCVLFLAATSSIFSACGFEAHKPSTEQHPEGAAFEPCIDLGGHLEPQQVPFVAGQAGGASAEASTVLYSLDLLSAFARPLLVRDATSTDPILFRDLRTRSHLLVERWVSRPSRLTVFREDGSVAAERTGLPGNTWNLHRTRDDTLLASGWDDGSLATIETSGWTLTRKAWRPQGLGAAEADSHIAGALSDKHGVWLISTGFSLRDSRATPARLLALSPDLSRIVRSVEVPLCRNAFGFFTAFPASKAAVLACNPHYYGPEAASGNPVIIAKLVEGEPEFRNIENGTDTRFQTFEVSEASRGEVILTARSTRSGGDGWKGSVRWAQKVDLVGGRRVATLPLAGQAFSLRAKAGSATIFSCVVDPAKARCLPKTFGIRFESEAPGSVVKICTLPVDFKNDFVSFAKEIP